MLLFTPPTVRVSTGDNHPLFGRIRLHRGVSLLKTDGIYRQYQDSATAEDIDAADITYLGGHVYWISAAEAIALTNAGYGEWIYTAPTGGGSGFGDAPFGEGGWGSDDDAVDVTGFGLTPFGEGPFGGE